MALLTRGISIGDFITLEPIGEGGQSTVWSAMHDDQVYALKLIPRASAGNRLLAQFEEEIGLIQSLQHPNILPITQTISTAQYVGYASPYFLGGDLYTRLYSTDHTLAERLYFGFQLAEALGYLHQQDIIHRDLKPMNILMDINRRCFLADFGIARRLLDETAQLHTGRGTLAYASVEQLARKAISKESDIYSFGLLLYEILCGHLPWENEDQLSVLQINDPTVTLPDLTGDMASMPPAVIETLRMMTHYVPVQRYGDAHTAFRALINAVPDGHQLLAKMIAQESKREIDRQAFLMQATKTYMASQGEQFPLNLTRFAIMEKASRSKQQSLDDTKILLHGALTYDYALDYWWQAAEALGPERVTLARQVLGSEETTSGAIRKLLEAQHVVLDTYDYERLTGVAIGVETQPMRTQALDLLAHTVPHAKVWKKPAISETFDDHLWMLLDAGGAFTSRAAQLIGQIRAMEPVSRLVASDSIGEAEKRHILQQIIEASRGSLPKSVPMGQRVQAMLRYYTQRLLQPRADILWVRAVYGGVAALLVVLLMAAGVFSRAALRVQDAFFQPFIPSNIVTIVAVDNASLESFGRWDDWSRQTHTDLIGELQAAGVGVIVFDVLFASATEDDAELAAAMRSAANIVQPVVGQGNARLSPNGYPSYQSLLLPESQLAGASSAVGHTNVIHDRDGVVRRIPLYIEAEGSAVPSLTLIAIDVFLGQQVPMNAEVNEQTLEFAGRRIPVDEQGNMRVNFAGRPQELPQNGTYPTLSYASVLAGDYDPNLLRDRIVLVGMMATAEPDQYLTPVSQGQPMFGVEILANGIETIWSGRFVQEMSFAVQTGLLILLGVVVGMFSRSYLLGGLSVVFFAAISFAGASILFDTRGILMDVFHMFMVLLVSFVLVNALRVTRSN